MCAIASATMARRTTSCRTCSSGQRGRELTRFQQDATGVDVFHVASEGSACLRPAPKPGERTAPVPGEVVVRARWLVGADGGRRLRAGAHRHRGRLRGSLRLNEESER
jgi:hypothetical protein